MGGLLLRRGKESRPGLRHILLAGMLGFTGCFRITINPQCPDQIEEGLTGALIANQESAGAIATYLWEARPESRVSIANPDEPETAFVAERAGTVTFTLTASDGLFQMIDTCTTVITTPDSGEPELSVNLVANPMLITLGTDEASTLLTCVNTGTTSATLTIDQLDGAPTELTPVLPGISVAEFPSAAGVYTFRCIGTDSEGNRSEPSVVRVTVQSSTRSGSR